MSNIVDYLNPQYSNEVHKKKLQYTINLRGNMVVQQKTEINVYKETANEDVIFEKSNHWPSFFKYSVDFLTKEEPYNTTYVDIGAGGYPNDIFEFKTPDSNLPEDIEEGIGVLKETCWFPDIGYINSLAFSLEAHSSTKSFNITRLRTLLDNPRLRNLYTAYVDGFYSYLEAVLVGDDTKKSKSDYDETVYTYVGDYKITSKSNTKYGDDDNARVIICDKVLIPGFYGYTGGRLLLCYIEVEVPSFRIENGYEVTLVNPSEYMVDIADVQNLNIKIITTNRIVDGGVVYRNLEETYDSESWSMRLKRHVVGFRTVPIYVNTKGDGNMGYSPRLRPLNLKAYMMNRAALNDLNTRMWDTSLLKRIGGYYSGGDLATYWNNLTISPKEAGKNVVSCKWFFGLSKDSFYLQENVKDNTAQTLRVGNLDVVLQHPFVDVDNETATLVELDPFFTNTIDREFLECPATTYDLYLPYYGYLSLEDIHKKDIIRITLRANIVTGVGCWIIRAKERLLACVECRVGLDVPLNANKNESLVDKTLDTFVPAATRIVGAVAGGLAGAVVGDAVGNVMGFGQGGSGYGNAVTSSTGPDGILNGMNKIFLVAKRPKLYDGSGFSGYDILEKSTVGSFKTYVRAKDVNEESFGGIPAWAVEEIKTKLKAGVYINP